jgi:Tfp pilus assembly protein FimT
MTLVELAVTLGVIGILATVAVPNLRGVLPRIRLKNDVMLLSNEVALTRVRAISKSLQFRISFKPAGGGPYTSYVLERANGLGWTTMATNNTSGSVIESASNFTNADELVADTNGTVSVSFSSTGYIILATPDGLYRKAVAVEPLGRVYVRRWAGGSTTDPSAWPED